MPAKTCYFRYQPSLVKFRIAFISFLFFFSSSALAQGGLAGSIKVDGSSTVYPITEGVSEEFGILNRGVRVTVGISGTGGGFKKFCAGETDISNASRPIKKAEIDICKGHGIDFIELPVAYDALSVVVNPKNGWISSISVAELKKIWEPEAQGKITHWDQVREGFPHQPIKLFGAGVDSGTYDYFTEAIVGKEHASRGDYTSSEDDNTVVQGVSHDLNSLGFFGLAYYEENKTKLKLLPVDDGKDGNGKGAIEPSRDTVVNGLYQPLSRPLFIYVKKSALSRPEIKEFVSFYLKNAAIMAEEVGYVKLPEKVTELVFNKFSTEKTGSLFESGGSQVDVNLETLLAK